MAVIEIDSDDSAPFSPPLASSSKHCLEISSDSDDLPDIGSNQPTKRRRLSPTGSAKRSRLVDALEAVSDLTSKLDKGKGRAIDSQVSSPEAEPVTTKEKKARRPKLTEDEKREREESKKAEKDAKNAAKAEEREAKRKQAEIDKAQRKAEKGANKRSVSRSSEIYNLRLIFAASLAASIQFQPIYDSVKAQLEEMGIKGVEQDAREDMPIIKWYRDCTDRWDANETMFKPYPDNQIVTEKEPTILLYVQAKELKSSEEILERVTAARNRHGGSTVQVFVLVEGIKGFHKREISQVNNAIRMRLDGKASPVKRKAGLTADDIEMALVRLQLIEKCHIVRAKSTIDTIRWLVELTKDVGARRKRLIEQSYLDRLGISGNTPDLVKNSKGDLKVCYIAMLTSMHHIGEGYARSIARKYPTMRKLYEAFERLPLGPERESMLVGVPKGKNKDGTESDQIMGRDGSRRIHRQLFDDDPNRLMLKMTEPNKKNRQEAGQTRLAFV